MTFNDDRAPPTLQRVQELCQAYGVAVPSDIRALQKILKVALAALYSADKNGTSLAKLKKEHKLDKAEWEKSLKALEDKWNESKNRVHELQHNQHTILGLASKLGNIPDALKVRGTCTDLEDWASEQSNQLLSKNTEV